MAGAYHITCSLASMYGHAPPFAKLDQYGQHPHLGAVDGGLCQRLGRAARLRPPSMVTFRLISRKLCHQVYE